MTQIYLLQPSDINLATAATALMELDEQVKQLVKLVEQKGREIWNRRESSAIFNSRLSRTGTQSTKVESNDSMFPFVAFVMSQSLSVDPSFP